jgi:ankyrin repeat protein
MLCPSLSLHLCQARLLLQHGGDPNIAEGKKRNISILKSLTRTAYAHNSIDSQSPGIQSVVVSLLMNRSPHDSMDTAGEGATPLHYAAKSGDTPMINLLLAAGADPRLRIKKSKQSAGTYWLVSCSTAGPLDR